MQEKETDIQNTDILTCDTTPNAFPKQIKRQLLVIEIGCYDFSETIKKLSFNGKQWLPSARGYCQFPSMIMYHVHNMKVCKCGSIWKK